jgi:hypothetical protein
LRVSMASACCLRNFWWNNLTLKSNWKLRASVTLGKFSVGWKNLFWRRCNSKNRCLLQIARCCRLKSSYT